MVVEKHVCDALEWMYDNRGILTIRPGECCDGVVSPSHVTTVFYVENGPVVGAQKSQVNRILGCVTTWHKFSGAVREVRIEEGFVEIGDKAFENMAELKTVVLPSTLTKIGDEAFRRSGIEEFVIPEGITELGCDVFRDCSELTDVTFLTKELKYLRSSLFENCAELERIVVPEGIRVIGGDAFAFCGNLREVRLPDSLREIRERAFDHCVNLRKIKLPKRLRKIENMAFAGCSGLESVKVPYSVKTVGDMAFNSCRVLEISRWYPNYNMIMWKNFGEKGRRMEYKKPGLLTRLFLK